MLLPYVVNISEHLWFPRKLLQQPVVDSTLFVGLEGIADAIDHMYGSTSCHDIVASFIKKISCFLFCPPCRDNKFSMLFIDVIFFFEKKLGMRDATRAKSLLPSGPMLVQYQCKTRTGPAPQLGANYNVFVCDCPQLAQVLWCACLNFNFSQLLS